MSRGGYTDAVDMWSLGCIFGELLQRVTRVGSADTPHLKIAPLFAIHEGILKTPGVGYSSPLTLTRDSEVHLLQSPDRQDLMSMFNHVSRNNVSPFPYL